MDKRDKIIKLVYNAIEHTNELLPQSRKLEKSVDTLLFDKSGKLDSLGMVNLIIAIEEQIEENLNASVSLAEAISNSQGNNYFKNVGTLAQYLSKELKGIHDDE